MITRMLNKVFAAMAVLLATFQVSVAAGESKSHTFSLSVNIDSTLFHSSYAFAGPGGGELPTGRLHLRADQRLVTSKLLPFTVWETSPDGTSRTQVEQYTMRFTGLQAAWQGDYPDEPVPAELFTLAIDGNKVTMNTDLTIDSRALGQNQLAISSEPLPPRTGLNGTIRVTLAAMFVNKI